MLLYQLYLYIFFVERISYRVIYLLYFNKLIYTSYSTLSDIVYNFMFSKREINLLECIRIVIFYASKIFSYYVLHCKYFTYFNFIFISKHYLKGTL
jgi:hypothetical protein